MKKAKEVRSLSQLQRTSVPGQEGLLGNLSQERVRDSRGSLEDGGLVCGASSVFGALQPWGARAAKAASSE